MRNLWTSGALELVIKVIAFVMVLYHLAYSQWLFQGPIEHQVIHIALSLVLVFLLALQKKPRFWPLLVILLLLSLVVSGYIKFFYSDLELRVGIPTTTDIVIGIILIILVLEATRQSFGWILPAIAVLSIAYTFLGDLLPDPFWHFPHSTEDIISAYDIGLSGMFGTILGISAKYIFLFIILGGLMGASGGTQFFLELGKLASRVISGGPAVMAVVSSGLVGTTTGAATANVAITGSFTIPMMKSAGYKPEQAGGIEAAASTGGALMPPVMGAVSFMMADFIGVPYIRVCAMAVIPAILYYLCLFIFVQLNAMKMGLGRQVVKINARKILTKGPLFIVPMLVLLVMLIMGYSPMFVAFWAILSVMAIFVILRKGRHLHLESIVDAAIKGALLGAKIGVSCACVGVIISSVSLTGIAIKFPSMIESISHGIAPIALFLIWLLTVILGCGVPPLPTYILVAILSAPVLLNMGIPLAQAHFFIFFVANFALITPPVGMAPIIAAPIAGSGYMKTAFETVKAAAVAFLLPFIVIFCPMLILEPQPLLSAVLMLTASFLIILFLQVFIVSHYLVRITPLQRAMAGIVVVLLMGYIVTGIYSLSISALLIGVLLTIWQVKDRDRGRLLSKIK